MLQRYKSVQVPKRLSASHLTISRHLYLSTIIMAGDSERCRSLKEALFEALAAVLSNEHGIRAAGEEQMKTLEVTEGNCIKLAV